jgi:hypothetical protein
MKNILKTITCNRGGNIGYKFQCDDRRASNIFVPCDDYFLLSEIERLNELLYVCNENRLNYNLIIEEWSEEEQQITKEIYIVDNNHKNK